MACVVPVGVREDASVKDAECPVCMEPVGAVLTGSRARVCQQCGKGICATCHATIRHIAKSAGRPTLCPLCRNDISTPRSTVVVVVPAPSAPPLSPRFQPGQQQYFVAAIVTVAESDVAFGALASDLRLARRPTRSRHGVGRSADLAMRRMVLCFITLMILLVVIMSM